MNNLLKKRGQLKKVQILCRNILGGGVILINLFEQIKKKYAEIKTAISTMGLQERYE